MLRFVTAKGKILGIHVSTELETAILCNGCSSLVEALALDTPATR